MKWLQRCSPCIAQFDDMKSIYSTYKNQGFEIIGVSTDKVKARASWQQIINNRRLIWPQYWDKDGLESKKLSITRFN